MAVTPPAYGRGITPTPLLPPLYGLDIETDTACGGLDPAHAGVLAVALSTGRDITVFDGPESVVLRSLEAAMAGLPRGVVVTWNGSAFDLPFLASRARVAGVSLSLDLVLDSSLVSRHDPLSGHRGAYRARWGRHDHLDAYRVYRSDLSRALGLSCSLKSIARALGYDPIEVDASQVHELSPRDLRDYVASDAHLARELAARRWSTARAWLDSRHVPSVGWAAAG